MTKTPELTDADPRATGWLVATCDEGSVGLAEQEIRRAAPGGQIVAHLAPGVMLVDAGRPFPAFAADWAATPPIFVRHICPVQLAVPLWGADSDVLDLVDALGGAANPQGLLSIVDPARSFSVQSRLMVDLPYKPFDVNQALAAAIETATGAPLDVRTPAQVLSVVCVDLPAAAIDAVPRAVQHAASTAQHALLGLSDSADNLSGWAGGMRRFAREEGQVSRSEFKLLEALEIFDITLPAHGVALDLGASPGGWTRVLRQRDQYVTAVDPGELDPRVAADQGVRHKRMTAEGYLHNEPDQFDMIVNDMRMDGRDSARLMVAFARLLYPHGFALMTLKLPEARRTLVLDQTFKILRDAYTIAGARQLFHNRSEITIYLRPGLEKA